MITIATAPTMFALEQRAVCRWCGTDIERRRLLGWLHIHGFYICPGQTDRPYTDATPTHPRALRMISACQK
jgi:hypothetical protein